MDTTTADPNSTVPGHLDDTDQLENAAPPKPQGWDYAEITLLTVLFLIGAPLNLISLVRCLNVAYGPTVIRRLSSTRSALVKNIVLTQHQPASRTQSTTSSKSNQACRQTTLRLHLTMANLMTVWVYGLCEIFWLITYDWRGGDFLCRVIQFFYTFCFYATSNLTASIAVERMCMSLYGNGRRRRRPGFLKYLHYSVWISWTLALGSSLPQLVVWKTYAPFPEAWPDWNQCVSKWVIANHKVKMMQQNNITQMDQIDLMELEEKLYNGFHLAAVFWIPVTVIACSYVCIVHKLQSNIKETKSEMDRRCRFQRASNLAMFRQHASILHRKTIAYTNLSSPRTRARLQKKSFASTKSPVLLMELPIVLKIPQGFVCQPLLESYALMTLVRAKWKTVRKTAYILLAYILCWSPYNILALARYIDPSFENGYLEVCSNLIVLNAVINPLIYGL